ncbi:ergosterol biosynthetic protein 28 homolog isoform X2 [Vulpes vulpes]|uniref:Ergosterol biosynthetic protein 28 homolog isoform X2 n=1 Tax=Vulpes vulpes TaxID=9627 RepID=A0A3Q7UAE8_VULVU|nr:probable ergosterol biosynthetic protein 28 isoform X2 [Vulpes vulpes]
MSRFLNVLRSWLVMVSIIAIGNTLQSFRDHTFLYEKLYTGKPDLVNGLQARTFGIWTLLSSVIRCLCAIDIHNKTLSPGRIEVKGEDMVPPFSSSLSQHQLPQPTRGRGQVSSVHLVKGAILPNRPCKLLSGLQKAEALPSKPQIFQPDPSQSCSSEDRCAGSER